MEENDRLQTQQTTTKRAVNPKINPHPQKGKSTKNAVYISSLQLSPLPPPQFRLSVLLSSLSLSPKPLPSLLYHRFRPVLEGGNLLCPLSADRAHVDPVAVQRAALAAVPDVIGGV
jgi:hypothetical protein